MTRNAFIAMAALLSLSDIPAGAADFTQPSLESIVGTYSCLTDSGGKVVGRFQSDNAIWGSWLRVNTTSPPQRGRTPVLGRVFLGYDANAKRWSIVGVDSTGAYWTRHSTATIFDGSHWLDSDPADGGRAVIRVLHSGKQYTFDLASPAANDTLDRSHTVCTRTRA